MLGLKTQISTETQTNEAANKRSIATTKVGTQGIGFQDNRPEARIQRSLQVLAGNYSSQQFKLAVPSAEPTQLRTKTKYGSMMGNGGQGPHTIGHATLNAVETVIGLDDPIERYNQYLAAGIILSKAGITAAVNAEKAGKGELIGGRYDRYEAAYHDILDSIEYYRGLIEAPDVDEDEDDAEMYRDELSLYVNDLRDMHPDSTYASDVLVGNEGDESDDAEHPIVEIADDRVQLIQDLLNGKGEKSEARVEDELTAAITAYKNGTVNAANTRIALYNVIMDDSDLPDAYFTDAAKAAVGVHAQRWVNLILSNNPP